MKYPLNMDTEWQNLIQEIFEDYFFCASIGGRGAFFICESNMDIDVLIILKDSILNDLKIFQEKWKKFVAGYRDIHLKYNFLADPEFSGDFISVSQAYDSVNGRGFTEKNGQIFIKSMESIDDENDENDYLIFLSMFMGGRFLCGNNSFWEETKENAFLMAVKYLFLEDEKMDMLTLQKKFYSKKEKTLFGFDLRYGDKFMNMSETYIQNALEKLVRNKFITEKNNIYEVTDNLKNFGKNILSRNFTAKHLMPFKDPFFVKERKKIFDNINAKSHWEKMEN